MCSGGENLHIDSWLSSGRLGKLLCFDQALLGGLHRGAGIHDFALGGVSANIGSVGIFQAGGSGLNLSFDSLDFGVGLVNDSACTWAR